MSTIYNIFYKIKFCLYFGLKYKGGKTEASSHTGRSCGAFGHECKLCRQNRARGNNSERVCNFQAVKNFKC